MMILNDIEFRKLCKLGFVTGIKASEILKKGKPVWRLDINLKDTEDVAQLHTQRHIERTFSHPHTLLDYVRKPFFGDCEITFELSKELEQPTDEKKGSSNAHKKRSSV